MLSLWNDATFGVQVIALNGSSGNYQPYQAYKTSTAPVTLDRLVGLFGQIATAEGWQPGNALTQWQARSVYFALEVNGTLAGGLQLTLPDTVVKQAPLPCFDLWPEVHSKVSHVTCQRSAHISILALDPAFRGQPLLFWRLVVEMWRYCVSQGITTLFIEVTPRVLPLYQRLGWPLVIEGELRTHWGEDCYLCSLGVAEVAAALLKRSERSAFYREIVLQAFRVTLPLETSKPVSVVREPRPVYGYGNVGNVGHGASTGTPVHRTPMYAYPCAA